MKYCIPLVLAFAVLAGNARAVDEPTRVMDIELDELSRRHFDNLRLSFAAERLFYDSNGNLIIYGTIVNHSYFTIDRTVINCTAKNKDGSTVASTRTYSFPHKLRPAQQGQVKIVFARHGRNIDKITYSLTASRPTAARDPDQLGDSLRYLPDTEMNPFFAPLLR